MIKLDNLTPSISNPIALETRELLKGTPGTAYYCQIVVGTDSLSVGVGMPARLDCVMIGDVEDTDEFFQKLSPVGRTKGGNLRARGIIYISSAAQKLAKKILEDHDAGILKQGDKPPDLSMPTMITASCKVAAQNKLYNNPPIDFPCTCALCAAKPPAHSEIQCDCSGCIPENITLPERASRTSKDPKGSWIPTPSRTPSGNMACLRPSKILGYPPAVFLSDHLITSILENFALLNTLQRVTTFVNSNPHLSPYPSTILEVLKEQQKPATKLKRRMKTWRKIQGCNIGYDQRQLSKVLPVKRHTAKKVPIA
ncbi:hypothetical protein B0H14DRAFT_2632862 [Mycena olivaceomarginata]|nr:hypothetical protein B0H14DRAFT_2632862 [Mycena olivaceomarginata]